MNKIYKVVWNATRGCYVVASELVKTHQGKKSTRRGGSILSRAGTALLLAIAGWGAACNFIYADVTVADQKHYGNTVKVTDIANSGKQYDITNQQVNAGNALNKFEDFGIKQHDVANLHMGKANHQINVVKNKIDIDGVVNAIKDNKIGGDVYFFSNAGIAVGANGVFNVGRLTLGTNAAVGDALYNGYYIMPSQSGPVQVNFDRDKDFYQKSPAERARLLNDGSLWGGNTAGDAGISFAGKINAKDSVVIASAKSTISQTDGVIQTGAAFHDYTAGQSADTYRNFLVNTAGIVDATTAVATTDGIALVAKKDITLAGEVASHGRSVTVETGDNLVVTGTEAKASRITSGGGAIALTASSQDAKLQADPGKEPGDGMISIKDAYIDSSSEKKDSGKIDITAVRNVMGVSRIDVDDATITAEGKSGHKAGDVSIHATAATKLYAWDIGDGAYALVKMGQKSRDRNTIKGDNVDISARATTSGVIGDDNELSDAEIKAGIEREKDHNAVLGLIEEYGGNFRTFGSATKTYAEANVDIDKTDIKALGDGTGAEGHGDVKITSDAKSDIAPFNVNLVGIGFNVGIGDVKSYVDVDDSTITSAKDTTLSAEGTNAVKMSLIDFSAVPMGGLSLDFSWAQVKSDIAAKVGEKAKIVSQGDVDISAKSIRSLGSSASNCGQTLGLSVGLGISDTKASADMAGTVYAKGDVSVKAENTLSENGGVYAADTVTASSIGGDTALKPTTDPIKAGVGKFFSKLKKAFTEEDKTGQAAKDLDLDKADKPAKQKKPWNKLGANASTALLFSDNDATASVTGKVRGIDASGNASDAAGAKSLTVDALTLSRSHAVVGSYQNDTTSKDETTKKDNTITAAISYLQQRNHATAFISGDTKTTGDTTVHAKTIIPWQTSWQSTDPVDQLLNVFFNSIDTNPVLPDLVDSWTQAAGNGDNVNGAASVSIVNYDNNAKAYIGKKDDTQTTTPTVDAAGHVNVTGETDITTVNLTGTIQSYLSYAPLNLWKTAYKDKDKKLAFEDIFNRNRWTMEDASKAGVGGAALSVHQKNNAEAYIDDGAVVTAKGSADVNAKARALNIAMAAAGGPAKSVAVDATVGVNRFDNTTKARIGNATVTAKDVSVTAEDLSKTIQAAGAIGVSGGTGIGASIAYNHINRDTEAAISGNVTADDNVNVSAKNTGEIIAASVAGAVAYDNKKPNVKNKAGSTGFHAVEDGDEDGIELEDFVNDMDDADENAPLLGQEADQHIANVANQDGAMKDNVAEAKGGLAAAANVSVNRIIDTAKATVTQQDGGTAASVTADALRVNGLNDSAIRATSAAIGANLHAKAGAALAGSFMYNSITADNEAYVDGATLTLSGNEGKDKDGKDIDESLTVRAENDATILNIAASGSGATKGFSGAGQISLNWVDDKTDAHVKDSTVKAKEATTIEAKDKGKIDSYTGAVSVSTGSSAAVEVVQKKASAYVGNHASIGGESLTVQAENTSDSKTAAAGLGVGGTAGVAGAASETFVTHTTDAHVGRAANVTTSGDADVQAVSSFKQGAGAGGVGGSGTVGIGLANSTVSMSADTKAHVDGGAKVTGKNVRVAADHTTDITYATIAGGLAGTAAINGAVGVNVLDTKTKAYTEDNTELTATGTADTDGIAITASDATKLHGGNGGASIGAAGGGAGLALSVMNLTKDTEAYAGKAAKLDAKGQISLNAQNSEDIFNLSLQAAGGSYAGLAGATNVMNLTALTKAYTDTGVEINQKAGYGKDGSKDVSLTATHEVKEMKNTVTAASGSGGASVGAAVDVGNIKTQTNAFLGDGNKVAAGGSVTVEAKDNMHDIMSNAISAAIGFVGLSGSISVYNVGSTMSPEDQKTLSGQTSENGETVGFDSWVNEELAKINEGTGKAVGAYDTASLDEVKSSLGKTFVSEAPSSAGEKGTLAKIGSGSVIDAAGDVKVHADDTLSAQNIMGSLSGSAAASAGASVSVLNTDTQTKALVDKAATVMAGEDLAISAKAAHDFKEYITGASVSGGVAGQGTVGTWTDKSAVSALLGDTNAVHAKNISITSDNDRTLDAYVAGASVALVALNGAVVTANVTGSSEAGIGDDEGKYAGEVKADEALTVSSGAKTTMDAKAFGAAAGIFGGTGTGADLSSAVDVLTKVGKNAKLTAQSMTLTAENTPKMSALATSAGVGIGGVGATVAEIDSKDTSRVTIADGASLTAADKLIARAAMHQPTDDYNAYAHAIAGSGGVINGSVAVVGIEMNHKTETAIGENVKIQAGRAEISSDHKDRGNYEIESIGAGGYSGTGADTRYTVDSTSKVTIGDGTSMTTDRETAIRADNVSEKAWMDGSEKENAVSGGAAYASGNGVVSVTKITHTTQADLGKVTLQASASELTAEEKAAGKTLHDKKAISIDAASRVKAYDNNALSTGAAVGAAHVKETLTVNAETSATVADGASLKAGETEKANEKNKSWEGKTEGASYDGSYKGGTIAIGTRNDADLHSTTLVDVFGLAGYAGSENDVTYTGKTKTTFGAAAETAKGDISLAAGRDSDGETGTISVSAHSDILNATAIPISIQKDPYAKADSQASLTVTNSADMKSDRDILLKAKAGAVSASGNGEVKDWVNAIEGAFGSDGSQIGKKEIAKSADVTMNGKAETGIHRKKSMTIGGKNTDGTWTTTVTSDGDLSYTYGGSKPAGSELYDQLHELQQKLIDYAADPSAKAAYEAEIAFLEQKMAAEGLGYFDKKGNFVETPSASTSELDSAKAMRDQAKDSLPKIEKAYKDKIQETQTQIDGLEAVTRSKTAYDSAAASAAAAQRALTEAKTAEDTAKTAVEALAEAAGKTLDAYMKANPNQSEVLTYQQAIKNTTAAESAMTSADAAKTGAGTAYTNAVTSYNSAYSDTIPTDPTQYNETDISQKQTALTTQKQQQEAAKEVRVGNYKKINTQIELTDEFFAQKGTEKGGKFFDANGNEVIDGKVTKDGEEYYLLHSQTYPQMTHDLLVGDVTAQLGDIVFEGDNVSGAGTLKAGGDAEVKITNDSPNNLVMGDVHVVGSQGTAGAGQGGTIYFNSTEIKGDSAEAIQKEIQKENKDKTRSVSFAAETRYQTGGPSVTIENNFRPQAYVDSDNAPYYAAPNVDLKGYIYNPRGTVTVTSANGDVYNKGTIYAGSVNMTASNGDFIQTYDTSSAGTKSGISSVGGNPLDDTGGLYNVDENGKANEKLGSGILANGNVFISARYVNINSKIQSGVPDHAITIPKEYKLFYMDGSTKVDVTNAATAPSGAKILVADKAGKEIEGVSYDRANDRFVISDVEVHGGHVSIVGTILNTTNDTNKARIEALDGYGTIQVKNDSDKNIELKTLSTGGGIEGKIEITDLDRSSGKITRKTTYTRKDGVIRQSVQTYTDGAPTGDPAISTFTNAKDAKYQTTKGSYYTVQTGQDSSTTTTYELHDTRLDWWGIDDKAPTSAEMLARGGTVTDFSQGAVRTLQGGAFVSDYNQVDGTKTDGTYVTTDKQFTAAEPTSIFTKKEERLWYTLGLAKKFDYKLVETTYDTKVTQYSLKSDYDVGIGFGGSENGGTLTVDGGSHDVLINGTLSNGRGASTLSGGSLTQGDLGYVDTGSLHMTATGSVGSAGQAIKTSADTVSGSAGGDFAVNVKGNVTLGAVSAGKIADITAEDGIAQAAGETLSASRVNLDAGSGAISGAFGALSIVTKQGSGEVYGLKASADGDIAIRNKGGDLYLDSVTSKRGDVTLTTDGSFIDNNFTDVANENAKAKLDAWSKARVLEGSKATISKQKSLLIAKVQGKYNEYQTLSAYVKDGKYTLDDTAKAALAKNGVTDIDKYIAKKQARYDELAKTVGTWKKADVEAYTKGIEDSTDKTLYGNAALTEKDLTADKYLTAEEKKEVLVGSAKSAQDLLVTFSGGSIKEGITDTQTTQKETAHVTGQNVTLTALGGKTENGKYVSGIGHKENGQVIDLSTKEKIESLTADQLIALASAERGDFKVDGKTVTVSSIRSIETNADGKLTAKAENGAIYLTSDTGVKEGSNLLSGGELRVKGTGDLNNVTVGAKDQIVLESGEGKISGVTIQEGGTLTARAKKGVSLSKDSDLVINTVYASDGDVVLDLKGHSLLAEDGHDTDEEMGTTYTNVEGENISIENVANVKGEGEGQSLGMKVTGKKAEDGSTVPGSIRFHATGDADITLFGEAASDATSIEAGNTAITNHGKISKGSYKAGKALHVYNAKGGTISGGTFTGADTTLTNEADLSGAKIEGTETLTVKNAASIQNATLTGGAATVANHGKGSIMKDVTLTGSAIILTNEGTVENGSYTAETDAMTITNRGKLSSGTYTAKGTMGITNEGTIENGSHTAETGAMTITNRGKLSAGTYTAKAGTMDITNEGTIENGTYTARGDLTYTDIAKSSLTDGTLISEEGKAKIIAHGVLQIKKLSAKDSATVEADHDVTLTEAEAGTLAVSSGGSVNAGTLTATTGDAKVKAKTNVTIGTLTAETGGTTIEATDGALDVTTLNAKSLTAKAGTTLSAKTLDVKEHAELTSGSDMVLTEAHANTLTANAGGKLTATTLGVTGAAGLTSGGAMEVTEATVGSVAAKAGTTLHVKKLTSTGEATLTSKDEATLDEVTAGTLAAESTTGSVNAGTLTAKTGNASVTAKTDVKIDALKAEAGSAAIEATEGKLDVTTLNAKEHAVLTSGGAMEVTEATVGSVAAKAGTTLHVKKLTSTGEATLTSKDEAKLDEVTAGTLAAESTAGSVNAGTLTAKTGNAKVKAETDVTIGTLNAKEHAKLSSGGDMVLTEAHANTLTANAGGKLTATTLGVTGAAGMTSGGAMEVIDANVGSVAAKAGTTLHVKKLTSTGEATLTSKDEATLDEVTAGTLAAESRAGSVNAGTLTATTGDAKVTAKTDATIGTLKAEAGSTTVEATEGKLDVTMLNVKEHAALTSGDDMVLTEAHANTLTANAGGKLMAKTLGVTGAAGLTSGSAMEVTDATVGSVMANAGSTLHVKKLTSTGEVTLTSNDEAKLDDVTAGTLAAESTAGSVKAGTLTATTGDAKVTAKKDVTIGTLKAEVGNTTVEATEGKLDVTTLNAKEHAALSSGGTMTLESASADTLTAKAGTTLDVTKIHTAGDASLVSGSNMALHEAEVGGKLTADAGGSILAEVENAKISGSTIEMTAGEDIRITDRSTVGKLDGVDTSVSAGSTTGSGAAGSLVIGEAKPHDFDASRKGSALLSSAGGKVTLSAKKVEIDTLVNGEGGTADLTISADNIGIDDLAGTGAQHVTIHGKDGQSQAHYAGIHSTAEGGTLVKDSAVEHLELTGKEPLGLSNTAIGGDSVLATDKIRVTIQKNPGSSQAEHFGNLSLSGYDIATDHVMTSVKDGVTVNGERFPMTAESVMNASLYEDRTLGRDGREKEEETEKDSPSLAFGAPNDKEAYEVVK